MSIDWEESKRLLALFVELAKKSGLEMQQLSEFAHTIVQSEYDPLPAMEWSIVHDDWSREQIFKDDDFSPSILVNVPKPDAQVILVKALREYELDGRDMNAALDRGVSADWAWRILNQAAKWHRLWAARHPNPEVRAKHAQSLADFEADLARVQAKLLASGRSLH